MINPTSDRPSRPVTARTAPPTFCTLPGPAYDFSTVTDEVVDRAVLGRTWAGMVVEQALLTRGNRQYVGFYDTARRMVVAGRTLGDASEWTYQVLPTTLGWDSHNHIALGLDRSGALHVSGNMHNDPLVYFRSAPGGDVTTLRRVTNMIGPRTERSVTYPQFLNRADGSLVFTHRDGGSGDGVTYANLYHEESAAWTRLVDRPLFDGAGSAADPAATWSAYFQGPTTGPDGRFHLLWVWRGAPDAATNSMLSYASSTDLVNWTDHRGAPLATPFTYGGGDVVDPVPERAGLLNGNAKIGFDADGRILITYHKYDRAGNSQIYAARPGQGSWEIRQISDWRGRWDFGGFGTINFHVALLGSRVLRNGHIQVDFVGYGRPTSIILDSDLTPITQCPTPPLPAQAATVRGDHPGLRVNIGHDSGDGATTATPRGRYLLRWESLDANRDQPRDAWPTQGSEMEVLLLGRR
ncbi:BNR repeat-containing protein [Allostreptomyces psammosilenae]|uniref:Glycosyl hydrolase family 32 N-terminal domain-containing protein n=1 Tax=Allostreptomyces psammosilenae TaxID=1892865 RepID=A0A852ZRS2_9ACTN|nr:BNR repeat-containing protein [Allostreptomyces psammosilenae]NYI04495.1 hypothetical protein [Allostreptomyces psammosilenae]